MVSYYNTLTKNVLLNTITAATITTTITTTLLTNPAHAQTNNPTTGNNNDTIIQIVKNDDGTLHLQKQNKNQATLNHNNTTIIAQSTPDQESPTFLPEETTQNQNTATLSSYNPGKFRDPYRTRQWNLDALKIEHLIGHNKGKGVTVAILDTGIDKNHIELQNKIKQGYNAPETTPGDKHGHGTHVAGIIAANTNNNIGIAGIAPKTTIWDGKITYDNGNGNTTIMAEGIIEAINANVDIISISMVSQKPSNLVKAAIDQAKQKGIPVIAAAGNDGKNGSHTMYPAAYDNVTAVSSLNRNYETSTFANNNDYVDLFAPGTDIYSLAPNNQIAIMSGTSQAAPTVAGILALLKSSNTNTPTTELLDQITKTATNKKIDPTKIFQTTNTSQYDTATLNLQKPDTTTNRLKTFNDIIR